MSQAGHTPNGDAPQAVPAGRGIRILVWVMGAGILVMTALLILGLSLGWHRKNNPSVAPDPTTAAAPVPAGEVVPIEVTTAPESRLYTLAGDGARIALHVAAPTGDEIIVIDTVHNRVISRILLKPSGGTAGAPRQP
ncbi:hypothetical protein sos41_15900 [Alphaproteobacteria bacterium SO-S41]|nr:hypothetical protein sos41_15900 [Alphaproteobacteria bacterium SO-S41]